MNNQRSQESLRGKKFLMILFLGILMVSSVYALGVTPARTPLEFTPGLSTTVNFEVLNSEGKEINLVLAVQGELAPYITLTSTTASLSANEGSKTLSYNVNLPTNLEPGDHLGEIVILELPAGGETSEAYVRATLAVVTQLKVYVPYPGKYANSKMTIINADSVGDVTFIFPVVSAGEFDLTSVRANVDIYNKLNEKVDSFNTQEIAVPSGEKKEIVHKWNANVPVGEYRAVASLIYDEGTLNFEGTFSVGSQDLELQEISVDDFSLGDIAKLEMLVENKWSEPISGAFIETKILNNRGDIVSNFKSASYDVEALSKQVFISYWDTAGVLEGNYETEISINYGDKSSKKSLEFEVSQNNLRVIGLGYVISAEDGGGSNFLITILIIVVVILILINLVWFFFLRKKHK